MAFVSLRSGSNSFRRCCGLYRTYSARPERSAAAASSSSSGDTEADRGSGTRGSSHTPQRPRAPKRDPNAVLKALSSTVTPLQHELTMGGRSLVDPLTPNFREDHMEYLRTHEAGRRAARYVASRWPRMFPERKPEPDLRPKKVKFKGCNETTLKHLIASRKTGKAMKMYKKLQEKGESVSMETKNALLALLAYYGLGNKWVGGRAGRPDTAGHFRTWRVNLEPVPKKQGEEVMEEAEKEEVLQLEAEEMDKTEENKKPELSMTRKWSHDNHAEKFFAEMTERDGGSYDAMIQGMVKFLNYDRAFEMFDTLKSEGYQASLPTYNALLSAIASVSGIPLLWKRAKTLANCMMEEPMVQPNTTTMNLLLQTSLSVGTSSRELAVATIREMSHLGVKPNLATFYHLLRVFMKQGDGSILYAVLDYVEKNREILTLTEGNDGEPCGWLPAQSSFEPRLHPQLPDMESYRESILHTSPQREAVGWSLVFFLPTAMTLARLLADEKAAMQIKEMAMADNFVLLQDISFFMGHYFSTLAMSSDIDTIRREHRALVPKVFRPREWLYGLLFRACEDRRAPDFALELWNSTWRHNLKITVPATLERFCGALTGHIDPDDADVYIVALLQALKKAEAMEHNPPPLLLSQLIKMYSLVDKMDEAWNTFGIFEKYDMNPSFLALCFLLKGYYGRRDKEKIVVILTMMVDLNMVLPLNFVQDICWKANIDKDIRSQLLAKFKRNEEQSSQMASGRSTSKDLELASMLNSQ